MLAALALAAFASPAADRLQAVTSNKIDVIATVDAFEIQQSNSKQAANETPASKAVGDLISPGNTASKELVDDEPLRWSYFGHEFKEKMLSLMALPDADSERMKAGRCLLDAANTVLAIDQSSKIEPAPAEQPSLNVNIEVYADLVWDL